jgi:hypothetical protein
VAEVGLRVSTRQRSDRLEIRTGSIRGVEHGREFDPQRFVMSFGQTVCLNTRVNFAPGHVEGADLYEVADRHGRTYSVMVPDVCGNVSVLGARGEKNRLRALPVGAGPSVTSGPDREWSLLATGEDPGAARAIPTPGTLGLLLAGLGAAWALRRRALRIALRRAQSRHGAVQR